MNPHDFDRINRLNLLDMDNKNLDTIFELLNEIHNINIRFEIVTELLQKAADSTMDNLMLVRELMNAGADVNSANDYGLTPLHLSVLLRKHSVVDALIESGANINAESERKRTSLHFAICNYEYYPRKRTSLSHRFGPKIQIVEKLLQQENLRINKRDIFGDTPLICAVRHRQFNTVLLLLEKGADPHIHNRDWETPLHIALYDKKPSLAILIQLLSHRVSLQCADRKRKTPVDILIQNIGKKQTFRDVCTCLKVIALHYSIKKPLIRKLQINLHLWSYLENCCDHVRRMQSDIIAKRMTLFDFVMRRFNQSEFDKPVIQVYKPIVERLLAGFYLKYLNFVLLRVSKSNLFAVLEIALFKYCEKMPEAPNCEETIDIIDHKEMPDVKGRQEITDKVGYEEMTDVEGCKEFPHSNDCKDTSDAKDSKDMPDVKETEDTLDVKYSKDTSDTRDSKNMPNTKDGKDAADAKNCQTINFKNFFLIINLSSEYFSILDVFHLIAAFSTAKISELSAMNYN